MDGVLFSFGKRFFFESLEIIPFSPSDLVVILGSSVITYPLMHTIIQYSKNNVPLVPFVKMKYTVVVQSTSVTSLKVPTLPASIFRGF